MFAEVIVAMAVGWLQPNAADLTVACKSSPFTVKTVQVDCLYEATAVGTTALVICCKQICAHSQANTLMQVSFDDIDLKGKWVLKHMQPCFAMLILPAAALTARCIAHPAETAAE